MRPRLLALLGGGAALLLAAGCGLPTTTSDGTGSGGSTGGAGPEQGGQPTVVAAPVDPTDPGDPTAPTDPTASTGSATPGARSGSVPAGRVGEQPVASRPGSFDATKVTATLYPVRRTGETASVNLYLAAQDPTATFMLLNSLGDGNTETSSKALTSVDGVRLVDPVANKAYLPAVTSDGQCVCSPDDGATGEARTTVWVTVTFAAPPPQLTAINVTVPTFGTFTDVPIV